MAQQIRPLIGLTSRQITAVENYRREAGDKAALRYAANQHRFRAETIVNTELAFAYNQGAHIGVTRSIAQGYMSRCEMVWSTAGVLRTCSRCLELKDKVVGYTDDSGVTLPPLHPRCRCCVIYREEKVSPVSSNRAAAKPLTAKEIADMKAAEEAAYNAKTGADFGFKKMRGEPDWSKEVLMTNPPDKLYGHTPNCQRCVVAHEARMRGYDVVARPSWGKEDPLHYSWLKAFKHSYDDFKLCVGKTGEDVIKSVEEIMCSFGEGSRAIIVFKWDADKIMAGKGHVIVAQCRERGAVNFGDPQSGERFARNKLKSADLTEKVILLRTDNLEFTDTVKRCCENRSE